MMTLTFLLLSLAPMALGILAMVAGALLSVYVARRAEAPMTAQGDAQAWADDLEAELAMPDIDAAWGESDYVYDVAPITQRSSRLVPMPQSTKRRKAQRKPHAKELEQYADALTMSYIDGVWSLAG